MRIRTITIKELQASGTDTWSVKDESVRGCTTKVTSDIKVGDKVVLENRFVLVTKEIEAFAKTW